MSDALDASTSSSTSRAALVLVGEQNPYSSDERFALYPFPERSAGGCFCRLVFEMQPRDFVRSFTRVNLVMEDV